jgi:3-deoxy-D-manno-octulosonic-acid transferase
MPYGDKPGEGVRSPRLGGRGKVVATVKVEHLAYNALLPLAALAARVAAPFNEKIAEGLRGRRGLRPRWIEKAAHLERRGRLIWFHVSSVGEYEQAKPVMNLLAERLGPSLEFALTFYSPSGMNYYERFDRSKRIGPVRFLDYLPIDTPGNARFCLKTLTPDMVVFVKFDLWPNLIIEAARQGTPLVLVSGTLSPGSRRLSPPARRFFATLYSKFAAIAAISTEDAERFGRDVRGPVEIIAAGDTRFDQVCQRIDASTVKPPDAITASGKTWIIAGSTWPKDEAVVVPGFRSLAETHGEAGLILVPHEPTSERLAEIRVLLERSQLPFHLLSSLKHGSPITAPVVVADGVGYLAELYRAGSVAYVGGSFTTGVHNVMEPAVLGLPVMFGPRIDNSYEARTLVELGPGTVVRSDRDFAREVGALLSDRTLLETKGRAATQFIRNHCGAALRCVDLIEKNLIRKG